MRVRKKNMNFRLAGLKNRRNLPPFKRKNLSPFESVKSNFLLRANPIFSRTTRTFSETRGSTRRKTRKCDVCDDNDDTNNSNGNHMRNSSTHLYVAHRLERREDQHKSPAEDHHVQKSPIHFDRRTGSKVSECTGVQGTEVIRVSRATSKRTH